MTTRNEIIALLADLPDRIAAVEEDLATAVLAHDEEEARLVLSGEANGRNEQERKAQLTARLAGHARAVSQYRTELHALTNRFAAARSAARLLSGSEE